MRLLGRLYRIIATTLGLLIGVPWLIGTFLFFLACSLAGGFLLFSMLRGLFAGTEMLDDLPSTALGVLGFALCLIPALGLGLLHWSDYTGLSLGFLRRGDSHGSARLSTRKERAALQRGEGLLIGRDADSARLLRYDGPAHLITLAPTRAGKGVGTIIPNLLTAKRSVLVIDPKGENARITAVLARSDLDFADLGRGIISVFLVLPPNRLDTHSRWLRLMVAQALQDIARDAERPQDRHRPPEAATEAQDGSETAATSTGRPESARTAPSGPVLFLLDEFAALGRLEPVERAMGLMAGYGIQLWPILQGETAFWKRLAKAFRCRTSQLKAIYGQRAGTFIANAGVQQVFGVNDFETAQWLSRMIGKETTSYQSHSQRHGSDDPLTTTINLTGRDLLTPDEIMQMPAHLQLLRIQGQPVTLARKLRYYADPEFKNLFDPDKS